MRPVKLKWEKFRRGGKDYETAEVKTSSYTADLFAGEDNWSMVFDIPGKGKHTQKGKTTSVSNAKLKVAKAYRNIVATLPKADNAGVTGIRRRKRRQTNKMVEKAKAFILDKYIHLMDREPGKVYGRDSQSAYYTAAWLQRDLDVSLTKASQILSALEKQGLAIKVYRNWSKKSSYAIEISKLKANIQLKE